VGDDGLPFGQLGQKLRYGFCLNDVGDDWMRFVPIGPSRGLGVHATHTASRCGLPFPDVAAELTE